MYPSNLAANTYAKVGMETGVSFADSHKLILMLYEGAIMAISNAILHMERNDIGRKGASISHAISIIDSGLKASLDLESGGEIARNLLTLYEYMSHRLLLANLNNDKAGLEEVSKLLTDLKGAWEEIGKKQATPSHAEPEQPKNRASISYGQI